MSQAKASRFSPMAIWVNAALALAAFFALAPLLWMISVSFMQPGESNALPPPLWPAKPTLANYQQLLAQTGIDQCGSPSQSIGAMPTCPSPALTRP